MGTHDVTPLPESTYRVQFHAGFTFRDATAIIPYLAHLGVTHLYASPYLKAKPGSTHGYDVIDHCALNPELGSQADYDVMVEALKLHGMSHILDMVPNHVGVATNDNKWWNDVLAHGRASKYADYFDIAWRGSPRPELHDKLLLPVLGKPYARALESGELRLASDDDGNFAVHYYDRRFPIDPQTYPIIRQHSLKRLNGHVGHPASFDALDDLLNCQHYRLAYWRVASDEINYRRFFDINDLAALAMERPEVFEATHAFVLRLLAEGKLAGLRIDHPDGLYDPRQYLERLQLHYAAAVSADPASKPLYVVVEKILAADEPLPPDWPVHGTSGYDFLNKINGLFIQRENEDALTRVYDRFTGDPSPFPDIVYCKKLLILDTAFASELQMLANRLARLAAEHRSSRDFTDRGLRHALREIVACFPVYRSYISTQGVHASDIAHVETAVEEAIRRNPNVDASIFHFIRDTILLRIPPNMTEAERGDRIKFAAKFQQLTAPVTAKGVEDTAFYVYNRFTSLNEVGGDPGLFGISPDDLHQYLANRQANWPHALSALSTHDTKRSEDVRARLNVLSEIPEEWAAAVERWSRINESHRAEMAGLNVPGPNEEYLLYQTLVGAWPIDPADEGEPLLSRILAYMEKALREAKVFTHWTDPNADYEQAVQTFITRILDPRSGGDFLADFRPFQRRISDLGLINSLAQTVLRLTAPGAPDTYRGSELWDFSLVDPDNRRPVDYARRQRMLAELQSGFTKAGEDRRALARELLRSKNDGRIKMYVTSTLLTHRRANPGLFSHGRYTPGQPTGPRADHVFAFAREHAGGQAIVIVPRLVHSLTRDETDAPHGEQAWRGTALQFELSPTPAPYHNVFTGAQVHPTNVSGRIMLHLAQTIADFPVAVLVG
ncbi:MAG TPA: malto-oligosyltrehalose synthase [Tepidisphaeraceae bacterium]|jgi:(1->4)-alpha-D-glucan 1-alpha-D-glucosylmutase